MKWGKKQTDDLNKKIIKSLFFLDRSFKEYVLSYL